MASDSLVWELVKRNNAFLVKRGRTSRVGAVQFSGEDGNLRNVNSFSSSGLANSKTVHVGAVETEGDDKVSFSAEVTTRAFRKSKSRPTTNAKHTRPLKRGTYDVRRSARIVEAACATGNYRKDLRKAALSRYHAVYRDTRAQADVGKKYKVKRGRRSSQQA